MTKVSPTRLPAVLRERGEALRRFASGGIAAAPRTELRAAAQGLIERCGLELARCADRPDDPEHLARGVRSIFEANLILRYVLTSPANTMHWLALRVKEEIDLLKGALRFVYDDTTPAQTAPIQQRIAELEKYLEDRGVPLPGRLPKWDQLARTFGVEQDYSGLYGAYSKYLHPCAWNTVKPDKSWDPTFASVFLVHAQLYAMDAATRAAEALEVPTDALTTGSWAQAG